MSNFLASVVDGLLAMACLAVVGFLVKRTRDFLLRRKYPLRGLYATRFEDPVTGDEPTKATLRLHQRGMRLWGPTWNLHDDRRWHIEARVAQTGKINGTYRGDAPTDQSLGGIYLQPETSGAGLKGMWAGFDAASGQVGAGKYEWQRIPKIQVRKARTKDSSDALAILGGGLGARYIDSRELQAFIQARDSKFCLVASDESKEIVGVATGAVTALDKLLATLPSDMQETMGHHLVAYQDLRVGRLHAVAVAENRQNAGIGTAMVIKAVEKLVATSADSVLTIAWTNPDGTCAIQGVVKSLGFHELAVVPCFWLEDSKARNYHCPKCGQPCTCSATIFTATRGVLLPRLKSHEHKWYSWRNMLDFLFHFDRQAS